MARYSKEFKSEALKLSDEIDVKKAASQLGLPYYTLADWRNARKHTEPEPELSDTELKLQMFCGIALIYITNPVEQKVTVNDSTIRTTKNVLNTVLDFIH